MSSHSNSVPKSAWRSPYFGPYSNYVKQSKSPLYPDYDGAPVHCACLITSNLIARTPKISTSRLRLESTEGIKNAQCCPLLGSISWKMIMYVHCTSRRDQTNGNKLWVPLMILFGFLMAEVSAGADWCPLDRFTKTFFWNFQSIPADLCYILIYKQMLEKAFCSNIAPSLSSGNHLFYKAEYMGRSCPNQVWTITFDWSALATWNKHFQTAFW